MINETYVKYEATTLYQFEILLFLQKGHINYVSDPQFAHHCFEPTCLTASNSQCLDALPAKMSAFNMLHAARGAARIFLRGGLKLWKQKPCKGKIACDYYSQEKHLICGKTIDCTHHENWGSFQLTCHLVSLIFFPDDRKTRQT